MKEPDSLPSGGCRNRDLLTAVAAMIFLPTVIFAFSLRPAPAALTIAGCALAFWTMQRQPREPSAIFLDAPVAWLRLAACVAIAAVLLLLGGEANVFQGRIDWRIREGVLADVVRDGLTAAYVYEGGQYILRAPLGMYMVPMLVGRAFGLVAAHVGLVAQNAAILGSVFYLFSRLGTGWRHLGVMIAYGGLSLVGFLVLTGFTEIQRQQFVVRFSLDAWHPYLQFTSSIVQFFWVPNHALPGWWLTVLTILRVRKQIDSATLAAGIVGALFWSPLVIVPIAFWLVCFALADLRTHLISPRVWTALAAGACLLPVVAYMTAGAATIHHSMGTELFLFWPLYLLFMLVQLGPAIYIYLNRRYLPDGGLALLALALPPLLVLPLFNFGPANDLMQRGVIPSLAILAYLIGAIVTRPGQGRRPGLYVGWAMVALSSASGLMEIYFAVSRPPFEISDCNIMEVHDALGVHDRGVPANYVAEISRMPAWLMNIDGARPKPARFRRCWSDIDYRDDPPPK